MPIKKVTRSTRATKASSKATLSDVVLDENIDAQSEGTETKKKSSKPTAAAKKVLGERNAPNDPDLSPLKETSKSQSASQKSIRSKKGKKAAAGEPKEDPQSLESRATTPVPSSPSKKRLPEEQVQTFLQNYDLESQSKLSRLRAQLEMNIQSSITRMQLAIERIPRAVRELSLADFMDDYGADIHTFMNNAPVQHLKETQEEWDQIREERSPVKAKRAKKEQEPISKAGRPVNSTTSRTAATTKKKTTRTTRGASTAPASPVSSKPAPSLSTFQPALPKEALQTPKPRMARPGEVIQWQSINGSPICGIIGQDGRVVPVSFP